VFPVAATQHWRSADDGVAPGTTSGGRCIRVIRAVFVPFRSLGHWRRHRLIFIISLHFIGAGGGVALLHHVGQLVGQQLLPRTVVWLVGALAEEDVAAGGKCFGADGAVQVVGLAAGVQAYTAEISAESLFHRLAHVAGQPLPTAAGCFQRLLGAGVQLAAVAPDGGRGSAFGLQLFFFCFLCFLALQALGLYLFFLGFLYLLPLHTGDGGGERFGLQRFFL